MKIAAIVPMRHNSERVKSKNYRLFAGRPLFHHIISTLHAVPSVSEICVDTDSPVMTADIHQTFPSVKVLQRPKHLRDGGISMNAVLANTLSQIEADAFLQTHSTNPLLQSATIEQAIRVFQDSSKDHDSLFGVTRLQTRLYDHRGQPINHDPAVLLRTQDLPPVYEENSNLYLFTRESFAVTGNRIGRRPYLFEIAKDEAWDIDEETDFRIGELLYENKQEQP